MEAGGIAMGAKRKIVSEQEVLNWFREKRTYRWMADRYLEKYSLQVSPSMFGNFRARMGLDVRIVHDEELIPWQVKEQHRWDYPIYMLRYVARLRAGKELPPKVMGRLNAWLRMIKQENVVVHYDPDTAEGWWYVQPRPGVDTDLIRVPNQQRPAGGRDD